MKSRTCLLMLDVNRHGDVEHGVLYEQSDGMLIELLGSFEADPFGPVLALAQWLHRVLKPLSSLPGK